MDVVPKCEQYVIVYLGDIWCNGNIYNIYLTWGWVSHLWGPPHVRGMLYVPVNKIKITILGMWIGHVIIYNQLGPPINLFFVNVVSFTIYT